MDFDELRVPTSFCKRSHTHICLYKPVCTCIWHHQVEVSLNWLWVGWCAHLFPYLCMHTRCRWVQISTLNPEERIVGMSTPGMSICYLADSRLTTHSLLFLCDQVWWERAAIIVGYTYIPIYMYIYTHIYIYTSICMYLLPASVYSVLI